MIADRHQQACGVEVPARAQKVTAADGRYVALTVTRLATLLGLGDHERTRLRVLARRFRRGNPRPAAEASTVQEGLVTMRVGSRVGGGGQHVGALETGSSAVGAGRDHEVTVGASLPSQREAGDRPAADSLRVAAGVADAESAELDRWFLSSMRPPAPSSPEIELPEATAPSHASGGWRRRVGWVFVAACLAFGLCIVAAAAARARTSAAGRTSDSDSQTVTGAAQMFASSVPALPVESPAGAPAARSNHDVAAASPVHVSYATSAPASPQARPASGPSSKGGNLRLPRSALGHRLFVDGHAAGEAAALVHLPCGRHTVRIGGQGRERPVDVPCGATVALAQ